MPKMFISIKWKFLLVGIILVFLPIIVLGLVLYHTYRIEAGETTRRDLKLIATGWYTVADVYYEELQRILKREEYLVEKRLGSIALDVKRMIDLEAAAHTPASEARLMTTLADIRIGRSGYVFILDGTGKYILSEQHRYDGQTLDEYVTKGLVGQYRMIVEQARQLKGDDVKTFYYDWVDPGSSEVRKKVAVLTYLPDKDWIIGASAYFTDFKSYEMEKTVQDELKDRMVRQKIGEHGYVFVFNSAGSYVVSKDRFRDGENVMTARDNHGHFIVQDIISRAHALKKGELFIAEYPWRNIGDKGMLKKIAAVTYYPQWDWVIGASAYEVDYLKGLDTIKWRVLQLCSFFLALGSLVAYLFAMWISRPIRKLEEAAVREDLNVKISDEVLYSNDEIGNLANAFAKMMRHLGEKIGELERSRLELMRINKDLERTQNRLGQSEKLAAIGQLAAGVAHEINNPLSYVMSNLGTLEQYVRTYEEILDGYDAIFREDASTGSTKESCDKAREARELRERRRLDVIRRDMADLLAELYSGLERVKRIVVDLRIFARSEQDAKVEADVKEIIEKVLTIVGNEIKYNAVVVKEYGDLPLVSCYPQKLGQVFMNIIVNAAQAVTPGAGRIRIRTFVEGNDVMVEISDNGCGIRPEMQDRIFEPFFTTKPVGKGTGLGLSVSYEIVKNHGGDIYVRSDVGQGTVMTVRLPVRPV
ncbi:MAG: Cache 3/Cache 2 fusion domain-containing protein [Candidatus Omnitrophica bacterium]|nr:Cache 3/Cache 2 fusion domain-containing protein [Candidatus Omnitrophota bacterium]